MVGIGMGLPVPEWPNNPRERGAWGGDRLVAAPASTDNIEAEPPQALEGAGGGPPKEPAPAVLRCIVCSAVPVTTAAVSSFNFQVTAGGCDVGRYA